MLEGDANTRYFHACLGARCRRNQLSALRVGSSWVDGVDEVKDEIKCHFERIFSEVTYSRPKLDGVLFNMISAEDNAFLTAPFSLEEIKDAIWSCDSDKSSRPDGFNFNFYKKFWELLKHEVYDFIQEFFLNAAFLKTVIASFLALIPKKDHP